MGDRRTRLMANRLKMAEIQAIQTLRLRGWSRRRIARELGIHRETVGRYVDLAASKPANPPPGSEDENQPNLPAGCDVQNQPNPPTGCCGPPSACEPFRDIIIEALEQGLSGQRIWQELRSDHDFRGGYDCVKRFVRRLNAATP